MSAKNEATALLRSLLILRKERHRHNDYHSFRISIGHDGR